MPETFERITISHDDTECYFHMLGDNRKYFDLESMGESHPKHKEYINQHRYELMRGLYQLREMIETHENIE